MNQERRHRHPKEQLSFSQGPTHNIPDPILFSTSLRRELAHPSFRGEKPKIELPTHTIKKQIMKKGEFIDTILVAQSKNGPARVKILEDAFGVKLERQEMAGLQAFRLTAYLLVWKTGKGSEAKWQMAPGQIVSCYTDQAKKISKKKLKEMELMLSASQN